MRLEAQMKGGFYPAPDDAIDLVLTRLAGREDATILDPCAGEGRALHRLADGLGIPAGGRYAVELEESRSATIRATMAEGRLLAPADFMQTDVSAGSFSMVWCNPPFDDEVGGGGRVEYGFLERSLRLVATKGIIALVCPASVLGRWEVREMMLGWAEEVSVVEFPESCRKYTEVVALGVKRSRAVEAKGGEWLSTVDRNRGRVYTLPPGACPRRFVKTGLTDGELLAALSRCPLNEVFRSAGEAATPSPPLELSRGQLALVLAGGMLNTTLEKPGEEPILIKATPFKESYVSSETQETKNEGRDDEDVVTTVVTSERIMLKVRVLDAGGKIHDLT